MGSAPKLALPKEHGSWGMFFVPVVLGLLAAGTWNLEAGLFVMAAFAMFLMREPFLTWWRLWRRRMDARRQAAMLVLYGAVAAATGLTLIAKLGRPWLLPQAVVLSAVMVWLAEATMRGWGRSVPAEVVAVLASTSAAPAAYYAARGEFGPSGVLWLLSAAYFIGTVLYVKMRVTAAHARDPEEMERRRFACGMYHGLLPVLAGAIAFSVARPWLAVAAFLPAVVRALVRVVRPVSEINLKRTGWAEVAYSIVFLALTLMAI
jgi:hypothetical protein